MTHWIHPIDAGGLDCTPLIFCLITSLPCCAIVNRGLPLEATRCTSRSYIAPFGDAQKKIYMDAEKKITANLFRLNDEFNQYTQEIEGQKEEIKHSEDLNLKGDISLTQYKRQIEGHKKRIKQLENKRENMTTEIREWYRRKEEWEAVLNNERGLKKCEIDCMTSDMDSELKSGCVDHCRNVRFNRGLGTYTYR